MQRFATLGAAIWVIFLGIISIVELVMVFVTKNPADRQQYLIGLICFVIFGILYYLAFRLLGGWKASTWDGTDAGRKGLLFVMGLPGLIVGIVVLIFIIWYWLTDDTTSANYKLNRKKKSANPTTSPTDEASTPPHTTTSTNPEPQGPGETLQPG